LTDRNTSSLAYRR